MESALSGRATGRNRWSAGLVPLQAGVGLNYKLEGTGLEAGGAGKGGLQGRQGRHTRPREALVDVSCKLPTQGLRPGFFPVRVSHIQASSPLRYWSPKSLFSSTKEVVAPYSLPCSTPLCLDGLFSHQSSLH